MKEASTQSGEHPLYTYKYVVAISYLPVMVNSTLPNFLRHLLVGHPRDVGHNLYLITGPGPDSRTRRPPTASGHTIYHSNQSRTRDNRERCYFNGIKITSLFSSPYLYCTCWSSNACLHSAPLLSDKI